MAKKKQPYIPIYTGDYIKDTRTLSLEAKGAWSDLILFMWVNESDGVLEGTNEDFSRMVGSSEQKFVDVLNELCRKKICDVEGDQSKVFKIICRRLVREAQISQIRKDAVQNRYKTSTKPVTKHLQKSDNDIDIEYDNENVIDNEKEVQEEKQNVPREEINFYQPDISGDDIVFPHQSKKFKDLWANWKESRWHKHRVRYLVIHSEQSALKHLASYSEEEACTAILKAIAGEWKNLYPEKLKQNDNRKNTNSAAVLEPTSFSKSF